jgi:hypothetical protein
LECTQKTVDQIFRILVADNSNEVAHAWVPVCELRRKLLTVCFVAAVPEHLERHHTCQIPVLATAANGMMFTAQHTVFLQIKYDQFEPDSSVFRPRRKIPRTFKEYGDG